MIFLTEADEKYIDELRSFKDEVLKTDREEAELLKELVTELAGRNS